VVEEMPDVEYRYDPTGKPDPFRSFVRLQEELDEGVTTPLERFDLSQLQVTAIIWSSERPRALIRDPAGKGYIVSAGTPIGKNKGRVVSIEDNLVLVKETYVDFRDRATTKEVEMRLYESQGG
jgi:type IV pilus assembly protein PilP